MTPPRTGSAPNARLASGSRPRNTCANVAPTKWLQRSLERYRVPRRLQRELAAGRSLPARLYPVFRDRDELASSSDLDAAIQAALDDSDALIVICSPAAAASQWVNAEIRRFRASGRQHRIFTFIVAGGTKAAATDCAFPPALLIAEDGTRLPEPLAADPAEHADGRRGALLKIAAGLLDVRVGRPAASRRTAPGAAVVHRGRRRGHRRRGHDRSCDRCAVRARGGGPASRPGGEADRVHARRPAAQARADLQARRARRRRRRGDGLLLNAGRPCH